MVSAGVIVARGICAGPAATSHSVIVDKSNGTGEDMQGEPRQPLVPEALIEHVAVPRMLKEPRPRTDRRRQV